MREFTRGQKSKLADLTSLTTLEVGIQLAFATPESVDISCFGVDADSKLSDDRYFIFYNQRSSPEDALCMLGPAGGDNERFRIDLARLPATVRRLVFTATLDSSGTMAQVSTGHVQILANGEPVAVFRFNGADFSQEKAIILAELYFKDVWRFGAVGQGFNGGLSALLAHFGGEEESVTSSPPSAQPPAASPPAPAQPPAASPPAPAQPPAASPPAPSLSLSKVTLEKRGDTQAVSLKKGGGTQPIHINLNWDVPEKKGGFLGGIFGSGGSGTAPDLDLGCMFRLVDGRGGVIQPLGGYLGSRDDVPYIYMDKDDRSGVAADGENLYILRPDIIESLMVFALIYEGAQDFTSVKGRMTVRDQAGNEIFMWLNNPDPNLVFCAICLIRRVGENIEITKEERYFQSHRFADQHYGFGFQWKAGSK